MIAPSAHSAPPASPALRVIWSLVAGSAISLIAMALLDHLTEVAIPESLLLVNSAEMVVSELEGPPPNDAAWEQIALPTRVSTPRQQPLSVWMRFSMPAGMDPETLPNIMFKRPYSALVIYVDGRLLTDSGSNRDPLPQYRYDLRYNLPAALFERNAQPEVHVRFLKERGDLTLRPVWFAPAAEMQAYKRGRNAVEKPWQQAMAFLLGALSMVYAALWATRIKDTHFAWFAVALAMWSLHILVGVPNTPSVGSGPFWWPLSCISLGWFIIACYFFSNRYWFQPQRTVESMVLVGGVAGSMGIWWAAFSNSAWHPVFAERVWMPSLLCLAGLLLARMLRATANQPFHHADAWLPVVTVVLLLVGGRDYLHDLGVTSIGTDYVRYFPLCAPLVILGFGSALFRRYTAAVRDIEALNRELEQRVEEKSRALAEGWRRLTESETQRARLAERERLMREMHDGIGGQLVQAMALVEASRGADADALRDVLQACLDDLRLILDSSDPASDSLADAMAQFRQRIAPRLARIGLALDWPWQDMPELPRAEPDLALQWLRILQELITNTVKHARAHHIQIRFQRRPATLAVPRPALVLDYADDGVGLPPPEARDGRGLPGMRLRISEMGGEWHLLKPARGFACRVVLPLSGASDAAPPGAAPPRQRRPDTTGASSDSPRTCPANDPRHHEPACSHEHPQAGTPE